MGKKAVFFDADGTIIKRNVIRPSVIASLTKLQEKGILTVLSTGRSLPSIHASALNDIDLSNVISAAGGCVIIDHKVVSHDYLTYDHLKELIDYLDSYGLYYTLECNDYLYIRKGTLDHHKRRFAVDDNASAEEKAKCAKRRHNFLVQLKETDDPLSLHVNKIHWFENDAMYDSGKTPLSFEDINAKFGDRFNVNPLSFMPGNGGGEINEKAITKAKGMDLIIKHYHIEADDVYAIGDGFNDLQMLDHAAHAIAMGNAPKAVKEACEYVTDDIDHDGFQKAFQHYHLI
ncbi:Cof-type HAD-IIB family hydrolase [Intestinibaculum porci]|uniref:Cof-type HAD-IIB family hydrolase n=1 Tax=Intestinibaculum porci TaxID=2487118 RepID=UPI002409BF89|nr:Cof-type HAD-IIB family hydrolase [Intestinibaculum porci]MDD6350098.1 Cof-type HAD-IIB family hydrolase [Intestinibaculum porci]